MADAGPGGPARPRYLVIVNTGAGTIQALGGEAALPRLSALFESAGAQAEVIGVTGAEVSGALDRAAQSDAEIVVIGGGDGTISRAANRIAATGKALGVLPLGTMNLLAKDLGMPADPEQAVAALVGGTVEAIDVGVVNGQIFLTASGIGLYPLIVADRDRQRRHLGRGKQLAMAIAFCRMLWRLPRLRLAVETEAGEARVHTPLLFVTNNPYDLEFEEPFRRSRLDAGRLGLYVSRPRTALGTLAMILRAMIGRSARMPSLHHSLHDRLVVRSRYRWLLVANDGEVERIALPLRYEIRPGGLRVVRPARPVT